jgi:hypothetical protein
MLKNILLVLGGLVVGFALASIPFGGSKLGGVVVHNVSESFDAGLEVNGISVLDSNRALSVSGITLDGVLLASGNITATTSYNQFTVGLNGTTTITLAVASSSAIADECYPILSTNTSTNPMIINCRISTVTSTAGVPASSTISIQNLGASVIFATGTATVYTRQH